MSGAIIDKLYSIWFDGDAIGLHHSDLSSSIAVTVSQFCTDKEKKRVQMRLFRCASSVILCHSFSLYLK